jgi:hypothetical protein
MARHESRVMWEACNLGQGNISIYARTYAVLMLRLVQANDTRADVVTAGLSSALSL